MISFAEVAGYSWVKMAVVAEILVDPGFWIALAAGIVCLALLGYWLATGVRIRRDDKGGVMLREGSKAPEFTVLDDRGNMVSLSDYRGKKSVVLFFYPKANTPG
jgi:cytochrome oxidase Cu insertion factor (SCO1/SenC/PrrC family)